MFGTIGSNLRLLRLPIQVPRVPIQVLGNGRRWRILGPREWPAKHERLIINATSSSWFRWDISARGRIPIEVKYTNEGPDADHEWNHLTC
jgi:hypothetical protein